MLRNLLLGLWLIVAPSPSLTFAASAQAPTTLQGKVGVVVRGGASFTASDAAVVPQVRPTLLEASLADVVNVLAPDCTHFQRALSTGEAFSADCEHLEVRWLPPKLTVRSLEDGSRVTLILPSAGTGTENATAGDTNNGTFQCSWTTVTGGGPVLVGFTLEQKQGETDVKFAERCKSKLSAMTAVFPPVNPSGNHPTFVPGDFHAQWTSRGVHCDIAVHPISLGGGVQEPPSGMATRLLRKVEVFQGPLYFPE